MKKCLIWLLEKLPSTLPFSAYPNAPYQLAFKILEQTDIDIEVVILPYPSLSRRVGSQKLIIMLISGSESVIRI